MTAPKVMYSTSREGPEAEAQLQEPEPEPRKDESCSQFHSVNDMNGGFSAEKKHLLEMGVGEGDEDESVGVDLDLKDPEVNTETPVEATEVALPSDFTMEDEEEHLALANDLAKLEAEIALAEQLLNPEDPEDPEEPEPAAELLASVPMVSCQSFNLLKVVFSSMLWNTFL